MDLTMAWESPKQEYATGERLRVGRWQIGGYHWNNQRGKPRWAVTCSLPGYKDRLGDYDTEHECRERLEQAVQKWVQGLMEINR